MQTCPATPRRRLVLTACCASVTALGLAANIPALCLTSVSAEFSLTESLSGTFLSAMFWGVVLSLLVTGPLADRVGFRLPLIAGALLEAAGLFCVAGAHSFRGLCAGAFLSGLGIGTADALTTPLACALYREQRARVTNLLHSFFPAGMILAILLALFLMDRCLSWRGLYRLIGLLCLPPAVIFCFPSLPSHAHEGTERLTARRLVRSPTFWILGLTIALAGISEVGPAQWLPAFIEKTAGPSAAVSPSGSLHARRMGMVGMLLYGLAMTAGRVGSARVARHLSAPAMLALSSVVVAGGLLLACVTPHPWVAIAFLALSGLGVAALWPTTLALAGDRFPQAGVSMFSLLPAMGNLGGVAGPLVVGCVAEAASLRAGMAVLAAAPLLIILLVRRLRPPA